MAKKDWTAARLDWERKTEDEFGFDNRMRWDRSILVEFSLVGYFRVVTMI